MTKEELIKNIDELSSDTFSDMFLPKLMTCKDVEQLQKGVEALSRDTVEELYYAYEIHKIADSLHMLVLDMVITAKESLAYSYEVGVDLHKSRDYQRTINQKRFNGKRIPALPANVLNGIRFQLDLLGFDENVIRPIIDIILKRDRRTKISEETQKRIDEVQKYLEKHL